MSWQGYLAGAGWHRGRIIVVDATGAQDAFKTVQAAVDVVEGQSATDRATIYFAPGTYTGLVSITKPFISFVGKGASPGDVTIKFKYVAGNGSIGAVTTI